jgi:hypothetical protein
MVESICRWWFLSNGRCLPSIGPPSDGLNFSQLPSLGSLQAPTNFAKAHVYGVELLSIVMTKNLLTGETILQAAWGTDVVARVAGAGSYQPGPGWSPARVALQMWQQAKDCPECWGETGAEIPPPTLVLRVNLADIKDKSTYDAAIAAEEAAWIEAEAETERMASSASTFTAVAENEGGSTMLMGGSSCTITAEASPFCILKLQLDTNRWTTVTWESCSDHIYGVFSASELTTNSVWVGRAGMRGEDGSTSWTDAATTNVDCRFYKVLRMSANGDFDGDGIPNDWEVDHGLNVFNPSDSSADSGSDGQINYAEYVADTDPHDSSSFFHVTNITVVGNDVRVFFISASTRYYNLQRSDNYAGPYSDVVTNIPGNGGIQWAKDIGGALAFHWYRVSVFISTNIPPDSDTDGMPDLWTEQYFGHPTSLMADLSRTADNPDRDCSNNLEEYQNSTDPTNQYPVLTINGETTVSVGGTLSLSASSVPGATYVWSGPGGIGLTNQTLTLADVQPCAAGEYCVSAIGNGCTSLVSCVSVTVTPLVLADNGPLCVGQTLNLSITTVTGATYSWTGPNGFSSSSQSPSIEGLTTNASGTYCVTVTANGCATTNCTSVAVYPLPTATVSGSTTNCAGASITIEAELTGTAPWVVTWSDGITESNITASPTTHTVSPYSNATYSVTAVTDAHCLGGTVSGNATVTVTTNRTTSVVVSNEVLVVYNSNLADSISCKDYYINHRPGFSNANVLACSCTTTGVDGFESITMANLTNQVINPIINFIQSNPDKSIKYVVLMYGMPSRIWEAPNPCYVPPEYRYCKPAVQIRISRCLSDAGYTNGPYYEGSTCPFVATNFLGTTCLVTSLNMATLADAEAYIDKVASMYTGDVIVSARAAGSTNHNYYIERYDAYPPTWTALQQAIVAQGSNGDMIVSPSNVITNGPDVAGYYTSGIYNLVFGPTYATDRSVVWSGNSAWWIIITSESFNGTRDCQSDQQGCVKRWFASSAWGGTNYANTPVGAVSHVEEPALQGWNDATFFSLWEEGFLFSECAWASRRNTAMQAIGDPLVRR